jgi:hypothetical protein
MYSIENPSAASAEYHIPRKPHKYSRRKKKQHKNKLYRKHYCNALSKHSAIRQYLGQAMEFQLFFNSAQIGKPACRRYDKQC